MTFFGIIAIVVFIGTFIGSVAIILPQLYKKVLFFRELMFVTVIGVLMIVPWQAGSIARGETSPLPWTVFSDAYLFHGLPDAFLSLISNLIFLAWSFFIPAIIYSREKLQGKNRIYPFVINMLTGLILCTPSNYFYRFLDFVLWGHR